MRKLPNSAIAMTALSMMASPVLAQAEVHTENGITEDRPYTISYPVVLEQVDDGSDVTIITLRHPQAPLQCDAFVVDGAKAGWAADVALESLDTAGIVASWAPDFPGFKVVGQSLASFQSGPALLFEGESDDSPLGVPLHVVHAEAVDGGRTYAIECLVDRSAAAEARPMIDFIIANFSTRSGAGCCVDPSDPRG